MQSSFAVREQISNDKIVENKYMKKVTIPDHMMQPPFRGLYIAPSFSGKSLAISNLLTNPVFQYQKLFGKNVFIFSPTLSLGDPSMANVEIDAENVFSDYDEGIINSIVEEQENIIHEFGKHKAPHILLILDDVITSLPDSKRDLMKKLFFSARHRLISIIVTSQSFVAIPRALRLNASNLFIISVNTSEVKRIAEEQPINSNIFREIYNEATEEPYSFLHINMKKHFKKRYYLRYEPIVFEF